jgi:hypothetical protein
MSRPCVNQWKGCEGEVTDTAKRGECVNCRSTEYRWRNRKTGDLIERHRKLTLYDFRIQSLLPDDADERAGISTTPPRRSNVTPLRNLSQRQTPQRKRA